MINFILSWLHAVIFLINQYGNTAKYYILQVREDKRADTPTKHENDQVKKEYLLKKTTQSSCWPCVHLTPSYGDINVAENLKIPPCSGFWEEKAQPGRGDRRIWGRRWGRTPLAWGADLHLLSAEFQKWSSTKAPVEANPFDLACKTCTRQPEMLSGAGVEAAFRRRWGKGTDGSRSRPRDGSLPLPKTFCITCLCPLVSKCVCLCVRWSRRSPCPSCGAASP